MTWVGVRLLLACGHYRLEDQAAGDACRRIGQRTKCWLCKPVPGGEDEDLAPVRHIVDVAMVSASQPPDPVSHPYLRPVPQPENSARIPASVRAGSPGAGTGLPVRPMA